MGPEEALERQIAAYRRMRGPERLALALELHRLACDLSRAGIRSRFPAATDEEVEQKLRERIELKRRLDSSEGA